MPDGARLFYESWTDALLDDIAAIGGAKEVGNLFWPELRDPVAAARKLRDKLNEDRRDRLSDKQERLIMRLAYEARGFCAAMHFNCDETGCKRTEAKPKEAERADLQRDVRDLARQLRGLTRRLEQLDGGSPGADS